jgi:hypothetical protein
MTWPVPSCSRPRAASRKRTPPDGPSICDCCSLTRCHQSCTVQSIVDGKPLSTAAGAARSHTDWKQGHGIHCKAATDTDTKNKAVSPERGGVKSLAFGMSRYLLTPSTRWRLGGPRGRSTVAALHRRPQTQWRNATPRLPPSTRRYSPVSCPHPCRPRDSASRRHELRCTIGGGSATPPHIPHPPPTPPYDRIGGARGSSQCRIADRLVLVQHEQSVYT